MSLEKVLLMSDGPHLLLSSMRLDNFDLSQRWTLKLFLVSTQLTAIFAFGGCGGFFGRNIVTVLCGDGTNETLNADFQYPFR